ncbi:DUF4245 domain-containing protein [Aeromicrobium sp. CTD01-1L150]|uniref:DUF4245 domain-containing protein n=1 Tax=Aeromicrobium sp. CTD01-1L150 TaxID=3341830 RepID=UPI0035BFC86C
MAGTSSRGNPSLGDIVRSVLVLGVLVLGIWFAAQIFTTTPERPVQGKDLEQTVDASRATVTEFDLLAPTSLPQDWMVSSARPAPASWDLNVLTADDEYIGLQQALMSEQELIDGRDGSFAQTGTAEVAGREWTLWEAGRETALTRSDDDVATLVLGTAPRGEIEAYVASLSTSSDPS